MVEWAAIDWLISRRPVTGVDISTKTRGGVACRELFSTGISLILPEYEARLAAVALEDFRASAGGVELAAARMLSMFAETEVVRAAGPRLALAVLGDDG